MLSRDPQNPATILALPWAGGPRNYDATYTICKEFGVVFAKVGNIPVEKTNEHRP